jgi:high-affinity K+ transport system ATPase subunit B
VVLSAITRQSIEAELEFLGLIIFRNEPKVDSADNISQIRKGGIDTVMITGDSALTGAVLSLSSCVRKREGGSAGSLYDASIDLCRA